MLNKLNYLMNVFRITGQDLSSIVHVDSSLVSKWRRGKRPLKVNSVYTEKIVEHFMRIDKPNKYATLKAELSKEYDQIFACSETELSVYLKSWLTGDGGSGTHDYKFDELLEQSYTSTSALYCLKGKNGRRKACLFLLDCANSAKRRGNMFCISSEYSGWFYEKTDFLEEWKHKNLEFLNTGGSVSVIHPMNRNIDDTAESMLRWMPLHMTGKTNAYFIPRYSDEQFLSTVCLIENSMAMFNLAAKSADAGMQTFLSQDLNVLHSIEGVTKRQFASGKPLFKRHLIEDSDEYQNDIVGYLEKKRKKFVYSSTVFVMPFSSEFLREVLLGCGFDSERADNYIWWFEFSKRLNQGCENRHFLNLDRLKKLLNQDYVILDRLSLTCGELIKISRAQFKDAIKKVAELLNIYDYMKIGITDSPVLSDLGEINFCVHEHSSVDFFSADQKTPMSLLAEEITVVEAVYNKMEQIWDSIPRLYKNKDYVCAKLIELIETT